MWPPLMADPVAKDNIEASVANTPVIGRRVFQALMTKDYKSFLLKMRQPLRVGSKQLKPVGSPPCSAWLMGKVAS